MQITFLFETVFAIAYCCLYMDNNLQSKKFCFNQSICSLTALAFSIVTFRKVPKFSDARKLCCNQPKIQTKRPNCRIFCQKDANGIANSEDSDQSGSALFAKAYLSKNLGSLRYPVWW